YTFPDTAGLSLYLDDNAVPDPTQPRGLRGMRAAQCTVALWEFSAARVQPAAAVATPGAPLWLLHDIFLTHVQAGFLPFSKNKRYFLPPLSG
ncbi:MAG: hypothetical protein M0Z84_09300, partial [Gammaproteobacteria bacterium]|nr:hypothetical protein [Gammaproteobacteria bacterium]